MNKQKQMSKEDKAKFLITEPFHVTEVLDKMKKDEGCTYDNYLYALSEEMDEKRQMVLTGSSDKISWEGSFLRIGHIALLAIYSIGKFESLTFSRFLLKKHRAYTAAPLLRWKELGILVRLDSKIARLVAVTIDEDSVDVGDETPLKTLEDILGYCVLGYLLTRRLKNG